MKLRNIAVLTLAGLLASGCSNTSVADEPALDSRAVEHVRGTTEVPVEPRRVVVLEPLELDTAVALGVTPVGAAVASNVVGIPGYLGVQDVASVGTVPEPDLEAIAALDPDLILGTESRHSELYDQLSGIAPTVFMTTQADPWQDNVKFVGEALGKSEEAAGLLHDFEARCDEIAARNSPGVTGNLIRLRDEATLSLYSPTSFAGSAMECAGFTIPDREWTEGIQTDISPEQVPEAAADHVFIPTADVQDTSVVPALVAGNPQAFPNVHLVDTSYWISGVGPLGGQKVLVDLAEIVG